MLLKSQKQALTLGNTKVTIGYIMTYEIKEYTNESEKNLFRQWFLDLNARAAAKVTTAIARLENGNTSNVKSVGSGVYEYKINFGPGYRIYFAYEGKTIIILLAGGTKKRQSKDIDTAKARWADFKARR
jgi:putative addiction module killer protein